MAKMTNGTRNDAFLNPKIVRVSPSTKCTVKKFATLRTDATDNGGQRRPKLPK